jgi:hypothetical protein
LQHRQSWMAGPSPAMTQWERPRSLPRHISAYGARACHLRFNGEG